MSIVKHTSVSSPSPPKGSRGPAGALRRTVIVRRLPGDLVLGLPWASPPPARTAAWPERALVAWRLHGQPLLRWIALTSVVFYAFAGHWWFIVPMLVTTAVDYWVAIAIEHEARPRARGWLLALSLAGNLGMLAYFKYSGLMVRTVE